MWASPLQGCGGPYLGLHCTSQGVELRHLAHCAVMRTRWNGNVPRVTSAVTANAVADSEGQLTRPPQCPDHAEGDEGEGEQQPPQRISAGVGEHERASRWSQGLGDQSWPC